MTDAHSNTPHRDIARVMRRLALEAGAATMRYFGARGLAVTEKADNSPVTAADHAADAVIVAGLEAAFPAIPVVTEERAETHAGGLGARRYFLVDPLDGTKEFVSGAGDFTVNIALVEDGGPVLGAVFAPARERLFWTPDADFAVEEHPAATADLDAIGMTRRLWVADADNAGLRVVASRSHRDAETDAFIGKLAVRSLVSAGSSLKLCLIAAGEADLYPRLGRTCAWDIAAGHAVLRAAGGRLRRIEGDGGLGQALRYGRGAGDAEPPSVYNPPFVAFAPSVDLSAFARL